MPTVANMYRNAIVAPEVKIARGIRFSGSLISPAMLETSSKPSSRNTITGRKVLATPKDGTKLEALIVLAAPWRIAKHDPADAEREDDDTFRSGADVVDPLADLEAHHADRDRPARPARSPSRPAATCRRAIRPSCVPNSWKKTPANSRNTDGIQSATLTQYQ